MARPWLAPQLLLAVLVALVALTYQIKRKTFISVQEVAASQSYVVAAMQFVTSEFNKESKDKYSFRIVRVLKAKEQVSGLPPSFPVPRARGLLALRGKSIRMTFSLI